MSFNGGTDLPVVLYVEDDDLCRELMGVFLVHFMGLSREEHIHLFDSSTDFLTRLQALPAKPDVILLDISKIEADSLQLFVEENI
ncbi:MAG: hypothetical protein IH582_09455, partial [Afipia sp.]|nr:hypothetical protein [Afipia sp.]